MADITELSSLLENLNTALDKEERRKTLEKLYSFVRYRSSGIRISINHDLKLEQLFECLQSGGRSSEMAVKILEVIIDNTEDLKDVIQKYRDHISQELTVLKEDACNVCLKALHRISTDDDALHGNGCMFTEEVVTRLVSLLGHSSLHVSEKASNVLLNVSKGGRSDLLFQRQVTSKFDELMQLSSTVKFRVYELFSKVCKSNEDLYKNNYSVKVFEKLISEVDDDEDDLSQMVALEMLSSVANSCSSGMNTIYERGLLDKVKSIINRSAGDPAQSYLFCASITFFGAIGRVRPKFVMLKYPDFVHATFSNQASDDITMGVVCTETLFSLAHTDEGLRLLYENFPTFLPSMKLLGNSLESVVNGIHKSRLLDALADFYTRESAETDITDMLQKLYSSICQHPLTLLQTLATQPVAEVRVAALKVLRALAKYEWGEKNMALAPGFLDYLLNRDTEFEKEGRELKFEILKVLSQSKTSSSNLGQTYYDLVTQYVKDGPFYSQRDATVSFEKQD